MKIYIKTRLKIATKENAPAAPKPGSIRLLTKSSLSQLLASMVFKHIWFVNTFVHLNTIDFRYPLL